MKGKVALVTGASRGIGRAIAERFAREGAAVGVNYNSSADEAQEVVARIESAGGNAVAIQADLAKPEEITAMFEVARRELGRLDIVVCNAGIMEEKSVDELTPEHIDKLFATNVRGLLLCCAEAARALASGGSLINISSSITRMALPGYSVYTATKGAIDMITQVLAKELGPRGIRVNAISPGTIDTVMNEHMSEEERKEAASQAALGRIGEPEDVAAATLFFATDDARWVTGERISASGGQRG